MTRNYFCLAVLLLVLSSADAFGAIDIHQLRQDLKQSIQNLPKDSPELQDTLLDSGKTFEAAGLFSEARRCYQYLDWLWENFPPTDPSRHPRLKQKIAELKDKQDDPAAGILVQAAVDSLAFYQNSFFPDQPLECRITRKTPGPVWVVVDPAQGAAPQTEDAPMPVLYPAAALGRRIQVTLPKTPGTYALKVYDSQGQFLIQEAVTIKARPAWAAKLKIETRGVQGFGGTSVAPGEVFSTRIHNLPAWKTGVKGSRPWIGLFKKNAPDQSKAHLTYWFVQQKKEFTRISCKIKEAGDYQLRVFDRDSDDRKLLLKADLTAGAPQPLTVKKGFVQGPSLVFDPGQQVQVSGRGLIANPEKKPDAYCLVVPSWFEPGDICHGINHSLAVFKKISERQGIKMKLPDAGGRYKLLFYPHWRHLTGSIRPECLASVYIRQKTAPGLVLPEKNWLPGSVVRAGVRTGDSKRRLIACIIPAAHLQVRADKARYVMGKHTQVQIRPDQYPHGSGWVELRAPMNPGDYILALYDRKMLRAARPLSVVPKKGQDAKIVVAKGVYPVGAQFSFKAFPPAGGMPKHGYASFQKQGKEAVRANLYTSYMDAPVRVTAPKVPGRYEILFFRNGVETPLARAQAVFSTPGDIPAPEFDNTLAPICPEAVAAFQKSALLPKADLAQFHLPGASFVPGQKIFISYHLPRKIAAGMVLVPRGPRPLSLAQAIQQAVKVQKLDVNKDIITLKAPDPGEYSLYFYDTLKWHKAGPPQIITQADFSVTDVYQVQVDYPETVPAQGEFVVRLNLDPKPGFSKTFKDVYLYDADINTLHSQPASLAKGRFAYVTQGIYHASLAMNLAPGPYQIKIPGLTTTLPIHLIARPPAGQAASIRIQEGRVIPRGMATAALLPARSWQGDLAWGLTGMDSQGQNKFVFGPKVIKEDPSGLIQRAFTAPNRPGRYQLRFWPGTGKEAADALPATAVSRALDVRPDADYEAAHQPAIELQAYFAANKDLYTGMRTTARFTASIAYEKNAWMGILPQSFDLNAADAQAARKAAVWAHGLRGKDRGEVVFTMPETPGRHILCMYDGIKPGTLVLQRPIHLKVPDMARLKAEAEATADAFLETLPDYEEEMKAVRKSIRDSYIQDLEVPALTPIPVTKELYEQLENGGSAGVFDFSLPIFSLLEPAPVCAATRKRRNCEDDVDLALENLRRVNINFGDGVSVRKVVGELATQMASDLVMGQKHIAQAQAYYDKTQAYYDQAMKLKAGVEKTGWQKTVKEAMWQSTQNMLNACVTEGCLSRLGRKAIEQKLKGYNPKKMSPDEVAAWKKEYTRMVVLLDEKDLKALEQKTARFANLAGTLAVPDAGSKALEMAKTAAINTMKGVTMSMVTKVPGWKAVQAYYETLNVLRGALINDQTVTFMNKYRDLRDEGSTISQIHDILGSEGANHLRTSLRTRIENNPKGYKQYLTRQNRMRASRGEAIELTAGEIDDSIMDYMENWYQQEKKDKTQDRFYKKMKDAWYDSDCQFESYKAQFKDQSVFDAVKEMSGHAYGTVSGVMTGDRTYSSIQCARKAMAFKSYLDLRGQVVKQMAAWHKGKARACRLGSVENRRLQDQLTCEALLNPKGYKQMMAANAEACGALRQPLPPKTSPKLKELSKKATRAIVVAMQRSGNEKVLKCLCNRYSFMGSSCSYHPQPTKGRSPSCDKGGPPCIQGNYGCLRKDPPTDSASLQACKVGKALREFRRKDNEGYKKWKKQRKRYMAQ